MQAIYLDFWAQNGAVYQQNDGTFDFGSDKGAEAAKYLIDLIHKHHIAPPAAETNINPDISRDLFIRGEMAMFQSGPYNLKHIAANAKFDWGIAPMVSGPEGRVSVVHGVAAVGNAQTKHKEAAAKLLTWLGSKAGQLPLAADGVSFPGVVEAQEAFVNYWAKQG
ncbi:extracellular solute-binding protein [Arcanobacterium hippocoleae]